MDKICYNNRHKFTEENYVLLIGMGTLIRLEINNIENNKL